MNIETVKERLALIEAGGVTSGNDPVVGITGVKRAFAQGPLSLPESDFPLFVNFTGPTQSMQHLGGFFYLEKRIFKARLYVVPIQAGISGEAEGKVEPFIDRGMRCFIAHQSLSDGDVDDFIPGISKISYVGDSGVTVLQYASVQYLGVEFQVLVEAVVEQESAVYE